ncbi:MAG: DUF523 domain-containing protein [Methanosarcinales archaeon]
MKIVSACLIGIRCRYDGKSKSNKEIMRLFQEEKLIPLCPEQLGGLTTPREPAELTGDGLEVLNGKAKVIRKSGKDVTENFLRGAKETLKIIKLLRIKEAILKQRCPSCGCGMIYDGTFSGRLVKRDGVTAALLKLNGIKIITDEDP